MEKIKKNILKLLKSKWWTIKNLKYIYEAYPPADYYHSNDYFDWLPKNVCLYLNKDNSKLIASLWLLSNVYKLTDKDLNLLFS